MRRLVTIAVVLAVVAGGAAVADTVARTRAEGEIARSVTAIPGVDGEPDVSIGGFPFLTQASDGVLGSVRLTADEAVLGGLRLSGVSVDLSDVRTDPPYTAARAVLTAHAAPDDVETVLDGGLDLEIRRGELVATTTVLGLPLDAVLAPRAAGRDVEVDVTGFTLAGVGVSADQLPSDVADVLQGLRFTVDDLPPGMELTEVGVAGDAVVLRAAGTDLDLATVVAAAR